VLVTGNGTYSGNETSCHSAPMTYPWDFIPFCNIVILSIGLALLVGGILIWMHMRRKKALKRQLRKGLISKEQYERLK
jgi:hypothetical protein